MNHQIKKHIRILAERFNHHIKYEKNEVELKNDINEITLSSPDKYGTIVKYNSKEGVNQVKVIETRNQLLLGVTIQRPHTQVNFFYNRLHMQLWRL